MDSKSLKAWMSARLTLDPSLGYLGLSVSMPAQSSFATHLLIQRHATSCVLALGPLGLRKSEHLVTLVDTVQDPSSTLLITWLLVL